METEASESKSLTQEEINDFVIASHFNLAKVKEVLRLHPQLVNANAVWQETPVQAASHMGNRQIIEYLLSEGAPLDVFTASVLGMSDRVRQFIEEDPNVVNTRGVHTFSILYFPAVGGQVEVAEYLVEHGAEIDTREPGNTPLHGAAGFGRLEMTRWLLDHGANINARGFEDKTALQMAEENNQTEVSALLRERGAAE